MELTTMTGMKPPAGSFVTGGPGDRVVSDPHMAEGLSSSEADTERMRGSGQQGQSAAAGEWCLATKYMLR